MKRRHRSLTVVSLLVAGAIVAVLLSEAVPLRFAVSENPDGGEIEVRVQARQTHSGRVEVRAQSGVAGGEWMIHTPQARFLLPDAEVGRWYSSSSFGVSLPAAEPDISDAASYTQFFVEEAIARYERDGRAATIGYYNSDESHHGQWYAFIIDEDGMLIANRSPDLVGIPAAEVDGPDGYPAGRMVLAVASVDGAWVDYQFNNPTTGEAEVKHSWIVRHDGLVFGSGWYEDGSSKEHAPGAYTQSYVQRALELYRVLGREAALEHYSSAESLDGEWYVFIVDSDGTRLAHPLLPIGENILDGAPDVTGYHYRADIVAVDDRDWVSYVLENPETGELGQKHTWIVRHDGLLFASGWYEPGIYTPPDS